MDLGLILHMNCKDTIDSRNKTILIVEEIVQIIRQTFHHDLLLTPVHSLDNEALIIGLEHETTTLTSGSTGRNGCAWITSSSKSIIHPYLRTKSDTTTGTQLPLSWSVVDFLEK